MGRKAGGGRFEFFAWMLLALLARGPAAQSQEFRFRTGQPADLMVSGVGFNRTGGALQFHHPSGLASDGARILLCDRFNNRVLIWNTPPLRWDVPPDLVLGQPDFDSNDPGEGKHQLNWAGNVSVAPNGAVAVADTENDRLLLWNRFPQHSGQPADVAISLAALSTPGSSSLAWPWGVWTDGSRLAAVATRGAAILFWNSWPAAEHQPPDYVLRLPQFGTPRNISTDGSAFFFVGDHNARVAATGDQPATWFWNRFPLQAGEPFDFFRTEWIKGIRLPDGRLLAGGLGSLYLWNSVPAAAGRDPDLTLQPQNYRNGDGPDIAYAAGRVWVNNYNGNNIQVFNGIPSRPGQEPDYAVGSPSPSYNTLQDIHYIQNPVVATDGERLIASSDFDAALWIWQNLPTRSGQAPDIRISLRPLNLAPWDNALDGGRLVLAGKQSVAFWPTLPLRGEGPTQLFQRTIGSVSFQELKGAALDQRFLYLGESSGSVAMWAGVPRSAAEEPVRRFTVPGQPLNHLHSDGEYLCAAVQSASPAVYIYRVADLAGPDAEVRPFRTIVSQGSLRLNLPAGAITFEGSLAIANTGNNGILLWPRVEDAGDPAKAAVLGQSSLGGIRPAIGADRLFMPASLARAGRQLWVGEMKFSSRILRFTADRDSAGTSTTLTTLPPGSTTTSTSSPVSTSTSTTTMPGSTSTQTSTSTTLAPLSRYYVPDARDSADRTIGVAFLNPGNAAALLRLRRLDDEGRVLAQADRAIGAGGQWSALAEEIFGSRSAASGYLMIESVRSDLAGFFLRMNRSASAMDGTPLARLPVRNFVVPLPGRAAVRLINPSLEAAAFLLELVSAEGTVLGRVRGTLPPRGSRQLSESDLGTAIPPQAYLRGTTDGLLGAATFEEPGNIAALELSDSDAEAAPQDLYLPHFVAAAGYATRVRLVNLEASPVQVTARLAAEDGRALGEPASIRLAAMGCAAFGDLSDFGLPAAEGGTQGYLVLETGGRKIAGAAFYSDPRQGSFLTAQPLRSRTTRSFLVPHVVDNSLYWTGLALLNPGPEACTFSYRLSNPAGQPLGAGTGVLPGRSRWLGLVRRLPGLPAAFDGGSLRVESVQGLVPLVLFGTHSGDSLAALPAQ